MKKYIPLYFLLLLIDAERLQAQWVQIPDANFRNAIATLVPSAISGTMMDTSNVQITSMTFLNVSQLQISDLTGVQYFDSLSVLKCIMNSLQWLPSLPAFLDTLDAYSNQLDSLPPLPNSLLYLDISNNQFSSLSTLPPVLKKLTAPGNFLASLPVLPNTLQILDVDENQLTALPGLPNGLYQCYVKHNRLTSLPFIPSTVWRLDCGYNQLTSLPTLQVGLQQLFCDSNLLTILPALPSSLNGLSCSMNQLTSLPAMPLVISTIDCSYNQITALPSFANHGSVNLLDCSYNQLTTLPSFPVTAMFTRLYCQGNQLTSLPTLNYSLQRINCSNNYLTSLPALPAKLIYLADSANNIPCLPLLPDSLEYLWASNTGATCLPNIPLNLISTDLPVTVCTPGQCNIYPVISGALFRDDNLNNIQDSLEIGNRNFKIVIQPGNYIFPANNLGKYLHAVPSGFAYTIDVLPVDYYSQSPAQHTTPVLNYSMADSLNDFAMQPIGTVHDLSVTLTPRNSAVRGFSVIYTITVRNNGNVQDTAILKCYPDLLQSFSSATPQPFYVNSDSIEWNNIILLPGESFNADLVFSIGNTLSLGTILNLSATAVTMSTDSTPIDNIDSLQQVVVGSYDPNTKSVSPEGDLTPAQIASGQWLDYTICFQNTGTSPAVNVELIDTLSNNIILSSFELLSSSHSNTWTISNNVLNFQFPNINLADSSSDEPGSHGFVRFRVLANSNLISGATISNTAYIYFDFNTAIITNTVTTTVQTPTEIETSEDNPDELLVYYTNSNFLSFRSKIPCVSFVVFDLTGKLIEYNKVNSLNWNYNISDLKAGVYLISFYFNNEERIVRPFVRVTD